MCNTQLNAYLLCIYEVLSYIAEAGNVLGLLAITSNLDSSFRMYCCLTLSGQFESK
jgi:hypothetical protein